jgi:hypothetical protein
MLVGQLSDVGRIFVQFYSYPHFEGFRHDNFIIDGSSASFQPMAID